MPADKELIERGNQARLRLAHAVVNPPSAYHEALQWMREAAARLEALQPSPETSLQNMQTRGAVGREEVAAGPAPVSREAALRSSQKLNAYVSAAMASGVDAAIAPCTLAECPPGLFLADAYNTLGFKSEYRTDRGAIEAYIVESGEFFWGDHPQTVERQRLQIVRPISHADAILALFSSSPTVEGWRPIETAPKDGAPILAASTNHDAREVVCWQDGEDSGSLDPDAVCEGWVNAGVNKDRFYANPRWFTHWMPLPPAPTTEGK